MSFAVRTIRVLKLFISAPPGNPADWKLVRSPGHALPLLRVWGRVPEPESRPPRRCPHRPACLSLLPPLRRAPRAWSLLPWMCVQRPATSAVTHGASILRGRPTALPSQAVRSRAARPQLCLSKNWTQDPGLRVGLGTSCRSCSLRVQCGPGASHAHNITGALRGLPWASGLWGSGRLPGYSWGPEVQLGLLWPQELGSPDAWLLYLS